jgi:parvulin-like peptidyl-prolyl isomerase
VSRLREDYPGGHFAELLTEQGLGPAELRSRIAEQLAVERLLVEQAHPLAAVTDEEVASHHRAHQAELVRPAAVHAFQIVVRTREEARRLREELRRRPARFEELARRSSVAPEASRGGDLGWFGKEPGMPAVFDACLALPVNRLSEVIESPYGYHLFVVRERRPARRLSLAEASPAIRERLLRAARARAEEQYVAELRRRARIEIDQVALEGTR